MQVSAVRLSTIAVIKEAMVIVSTFSSQDALDQREDNVSYWAASLIFSVTRLGDLLDFGQVFKAFGNNYFAQISHIIRQFL